MTHNAATVAKSGTHMLLPKSLRVSVLVAFEPATVIETDLIFSSMPSIQAFFSIAQEVLAAFEIFSSPEPIRSIEKTHALGDMPSR